MTSPVATGPGFSSRAAPTRPVALVSPNCTSRWAQQPRHVGKLAQGQAAGKAMFNYTHIPKQSHLQMRGDRRLSPLGCHESEPPAMLHTCHVHLSCSTLEDALGTMTESGCTLLFDGSPWGPTKPNLLISTWETWPTQADCKVRAPPGQACPQLFQDLLGLQPASSSEVQPSPQSHSLSQVRAEPFSGWGGRWVDEALRVGTWEIHS